MGILSSLFGGGKDKDKDKGGYALGEQREGRRGRGKGAWKVSREHAEPRKADGKPFVEGRDYEGYHLGRDRSRGSKG
jgi:hypothetical protein